MVVVYNLIFVVLVLGPIGVLIRQMRKDCKPKSPLRVAILGIFALLLIVFEVLVGKSGQSALFVEKLAATFMLVSIFSTASLLIVGLKSNLARVAFSVAVIMTIFFSLVGYRNFLEAFCHVFGQQCFSSILMYRR